MANKKVLIAYASKYGTTAEVAGKIGEVLYRAGENVDIVPMKSVKDISTYGFVVLGTSIHMGKPLKEAVSFVNTYRAELCGLPVELFSIGLQMKENTPENREKAKGFLKPILDVTGEPVSLELFGGRIDHKEFGFFMRMFARYEKTGILNEGDWLNRETVQKWAESLISIAHDR